MADNNAEVEKIVNGLKGYLGELKIGQELQGAHAALTLMLFEAKLAHATNRSSNTKKKKDGNSLEISTLTSTVQVLKFIHTNRTLGEFEDDYMIGFDNTLDLYKDVKSVIFENGSVRIENTHYKALTDILGNLLKDMGSVGKQEK